jgi:hypothetical protein
VPLIRKNTENPEKNTGFLKREESVFYGISGYSPNPVVLSILLFSSTFKQVGKSSLLYLKDESANN